MQDDPVVAIPDINPVLPGFHPDPSVCRVDGVDGTWYYLVSSTFEYLPGLPIHRSRNLLDWELVGHAIHRPEQLDLLAVADSQGLFAPTIRHIRGRFVIVCTLVGRASSSGNFAVWAHDPQGDWSDPVWWENGGIDPSLYEDADGRVWAHGTRPARQPEWDQQTEVWVREMDPETFTLSGNEQVVWSGAVKGAVWAEGPHLYRRGGFTYLLASEGGTSIHHAVSVARGTSPVGPFQGNPANPIFSHRHLGRDYPIINVGHADLVEDDEGHWWSVMLASRPVGGVDILGRETFLVPVEWEDDWPVFAPGVGTITANPERAAGGVRHPRSDHEVLAIRRQPLEFAQQEDQWWTLPAGVGLEAQLPHYLGRRLTSARTRVGATLAKVSQGVAAGLALRYDSRTWTAVMLEPDKHGATVRLVTSSNGESHEIHVASYDHPPAGQLQFDVDGLTAVALWTPKHEDPVEIGRTTLEEMGACVSGGFVGLTYGVVAEGDGAIRFTFSN